MSIHVDTSSIQRFTTAVTGIDRPRVLETVSSAKFFYREYGKAATYNGGGEFGSQHESQHIEDERVLALSVAAERSLYRESTDTMHKVDLIANFSLLQPRYKVQKMVPKYGRIQQTIDANLVSGFLTFCLGRDDNGVKVSDSIMMKHLVVHALDGRLQFGNPDYCKMMRSSRRKLSKVMRILEDKYREYGYEFLMTREEDALDVDSRTLLAHYHVMLLAPKSKIHWGSFLNDFKALWGRYLFCDSVRERQQFANYVSKPLCIPPNMLIEDYAWYYDNNLKRRKVVRHGSFKAWVASLKGRGNLTRIDGYLKLVKGNRPFEDDDAGDYYDPETGEVQRRTQAAQRRQSDRQVTGPASEPRERSGRLTSPINVFCGVTIPRADLGNIKTSYALMRNYKPNALNQEAEGLRDLRRAQAHAREVYEKNTGKPLCLREYLRPKARAIYKRMTSPAYIYSCRITVPPHVKAIVLELLDIDPDEFVSHPFVILDTNEPPF